jgi:hypothetical protein
MKMTNYKKYHFADFTRANYRSLIRMAKKDYSFKLFTDDIKSPSGTLLLRHDVDMSLQAALKLAQIEQQENVRSTYFILLTGAFYNVFEKENFDCIKKIIELDHAIGVHFDPVFYQIIDENVMINKLTFERNVLQSLFNISIDTFSFHNPTPNILSNRKSRYGDLINTYSDQIQKNFFYCSDSNGYWRHNRLKDVLENQKPTNLQLLLHPEWWTEETLSPHQKIMRAIESRAQKNKNNYFEGLKVFGREDIDW